MQRRRERGFRRVPCPTACGGRCACRSVKARLRPGATGKYQMKSRPKRLSLGKGRKSCNNNNTHRTKPAEHPTATDQTATIRKTRGKQVPSSRCTGLPRTSRAKAGLGQALTPLHTMPSSRWDEWNACRLKFAIGPFQGGATVILEGAMHIGTSDAGAAQVSRRQCGKITCQKGFPPGGFSGCSCDHQSFGERLIQDGRKTNNDCALLTAQRSRKTILSCVNFGVRWRRAFLYFFCHILIVSKSGSHYRVATICRLPK